MLIKDPPGGGLNLEGQCSGAGTMNLEGGGKRPEVVQGPGKYAVDGWE